MFRPVDGTLTLAADTMRNNASIARQGDLHQSFNAVQAKATEEHEKRSVAELNKSNGAEIQKDNDGGQGQQYQGMFNGNKQKQKETEKTTVLSSGIKYTVIDDPDSISTFEYSV